MLQITKVNLPQSKYAIKCPYEMKPEGLTIHETWNDASAMAEISYMQGNDKEVSFHFAVDDYRVVQGLPLERNAWHAGDGGKGRGNRKMLSVEICYSKSGGERHQKAINNAAVFAAEILKDYGWDIDRLNKHQDFSGKNCLHRILSEFGWQNFVNLIKQQLEETDTSQVVDNVKKTNEEIANEVLAGKWGNGEERRLKLTAAGYDYSAVQSEVNRLVAKTVAPAKKSNTEIAKEVIKGLWGNGEERRQKLRAAGYDSTAIQKIVNNLI